MARSGAGDRPIPFPRRPRHPAGDVQDGHAPALQTTVDAPNNLPTLQTPFIGRYVEVDAVCSLIVDENVRLLVLTGPGGVGKTRIALRAAEELLGSFEDGVYFVALAALTDPELVVPTIAQTLGIKEDGATPLASRLEEHLRGKGMLLILDNFEQVASAAPQVDALLANAPGVQVLVTSRVSLHLYGEHEYPVPPMSTPEPGAEGGKGEHAERVAGYEAVQLFVARAQDVRSDFSLTDANSQAIARLCARLDGLPLALELAAARTRLFTPQALLARLDKSLPMLTAGTGMAHLPDRQRTLRNAIAWSYNLLDTREKQLFTRLSVFAGGCTLDAAKHVAGDLGLEEGALLDELEALLDKNLLRQREQSDGEPRFWMLATISEFALEKLAEAGEYEKWQEAQADFYLALAERASQHQRGPQQEEWFGRLERESDNFRTAISFLIPRSEAGPKLVATLGWFWYIRGHYTEGRRWFDLALPYLERESASNPQPWHAGAFRIAGGIAAVQGAHREAIELTEKSLAVARSLGDKRMEASALNNLGAYWNQLGNYQRSNECFEESLAVKREIGDPNEIAFALNNLATTYSLRGDYKEAIQSCKESIDIARADDDKLNLSVYMDTLGTIHYHNGDLTRAVEAIQESLSLSGETGYKMMEAWGLADLGMVLLFQGDETRAESTLEEGLAEFRALGDSTGISAALTSLGRVKTQQHSYAVAHSRFEEALRILLQTGQRNASALDSLEWFAILLESEAGEHHDAEEAMRATRLWGASDAHRRKLEAPTPPVKEERHTGSIASLRALLGKSAFDAAWEEGRALSFEQGLALALRQLPAHHVAQDSSIAGAMQQESIAADRAGLGLTEREVEVLRLVAEGLTNKDIAERLVLSHRTVQAHLYRIFSKLDVTTRSGATRAAMERRIVS